MTLLAHSPRSGFTLAGIIGLVLLGAADAAKAHSDAELYSPAFEACIKQSGGVSANLFDCVIDELGVQDRKLNQAYQQLQKTLSKVRRGELVKAQRAWIVFRDANCDFYFDPEGGSMARLNAEQCLLSTTANRVKELEGF